MSLVFSIVRNIIFQHISICVPGFHLPADCHYPAGMYGEFDQKPLFYRQREQRETVILNLWSHKTFFRSMFSAIFLLSHVESFI